MRQFLSAEVASKANKFQGRNITRWQNAEYDKLYEASESELDPVKRAALFIAMNDLLIKNVVVIPVVTRPGVAAVANNLHAPLSGWDSNTYALQDWYRDLTLRRRRRRTATGEPLSHPAAAHRDTEPARHQHRAVHGAGAGARRSVRRTRHQSGDPAGGAGRAAAQVRPR